jgi:hypothetical protein
VTSGTANVNTAWVQQTPPPITIGTTAIVFQQFSAPITYTAGTGLSESPTYTFNIANIGTAGTYGSASSVPVITTNAQGQVTGVTPTAIAISGAAVSGNISGSAGSVANALTAGTFLTSGGTFDGSAARTFAVDATDANTASKVVARDASGNFSAGTITATLSGSATSATTATNLAGGAANQIAFQTGSGATGFVPAPTASGQNVTWNGSSIDWAAAAAAGISYVAVTSNYTAANREGVLTDTSGGSFTVTLPVSPSTGAQVIVADAGNNWGTNNLTVGRNGSTIGGLAENLVCDISGVSVQFVYDGTTWEVYAQIGANSGSGGVGDVTLNGIQTLTNKTIAFGSNTLTDVAGTTATQTLTNKTLTSPTITSTALITASAGLLEYDGRVPYFTPQGLQRGVVPGMQYYRLNSALVGANSTADQSIFGVGVTLSSGTVYAFQAFFSFSKTAGTTSHTISYGFGGTATNTNFINSLQRLAIPQALPFTSVSAAAIGWQVKVSTAITAATGAVTTAALTEVVCMEGTISVDVGGTFIPQYRLSAAPGGAYSTNTNSWFSIYPIGTSGSNTSVGTWA